MLGLLSLLCDRRLLGTSLTLGLFELFLQPDSVAPSPQPLENMMGVLSFTLVEISATLWKSLSTCATLAPVGTLLQPVEGSSQLVTTTVDSPLPCRKSLQPAAPDKVLRPTVTDSRQG